MGPSRRSEHYDISDPPCPRLRDVQDLESEAERVIVGAQHAFLLEQHVTETKARDALQRQQAWPRQECDAAQWQAQKAGQEARERIDSTEKTAGEAQLRMSQAASDV